MKAMFAQVFGPLERALTCLVQTLAVLFALAMVSSLLLGVFYRYVVQSSLTWSGEVAMLCFSWLTFLTAALMVRENGHVRLEFVMDAFPDRARAVLNALIWLAVVLVGIYMAWTGFQFILFTMGQKSAAIRYPIWMRDSSLGVGGVLIAIYGLRNLFIEAGAAPKSPKSAGIQGDVAGGSGKTLLVDC